MNSKEKQMIAFDKGVLEGLLTGLFFGSLVTVVICGTIACWFLY